MSEGNVVEMNSRPAARGTGFALGEVAPVDKPTHRRVTIYEPDKGRSVGQLNVEFYVNRLDASQTELTDEELEGIDPDDAAAVQSRKNSKSLAECICSWDLYGDDGKPGFVGSQDVVPITVEMIEMVPMWVRNQIFDSLMQIVNPNYRPSRASRRR